MDHRGAQDLKHYAASVMIDRGRLAKTVHAQFGHASAKTTLDTPTPARRPDARNDESGGYLGLSEALAATWVPSVSEATSD